MLPCSKCGYNNELGRIFCHQCGQKLDLDSIKPPSRGGKSLKPKPKNVIGKWIRRVVGLLFFGVLLYAVFVMLQVVSEPAKPTGAEEMAAEKKWMAVERLIWKRQSGSVEFFLTEAKTCLEMKADLASLRKAKAKMQWGFVPDRVWMECAAGFVELNILATVRMGGALEKQVWLTYSGVPKLEKGRFSFEVKGGTFGRLNWPVPVVKALGLHHGLFIGIFERLKLDKETLFVLSQIEVRADRVILQYQPR